MNLSDTLGHASGDSLAEQTRSDVLSRWGIRDPAVEHVTRGSRRRVPRQSIGGSVGSIKAAGFIRVPIESKTRQTYIATDD